MTLRQKPATEFTLSDARPSSRVHPQQKHPAYASRRAGFIIWRIKIDRTTVYPGSIPLETDILNTNRNTLTAIAELCQDIFGTSTVFTGLGCVPAIPAALTVTINPGRVYSLQNRDTLAYSSLAADTVNQIVKQGIMLTAQSLACAAPASAGFSVNYLISGSFVEQDINPVVLAYYNAANPQQAFSGPPVGGVSSGTAQNTTRQDTVQLSLTAGVAATTGSQTTPATPVGTIPLWVVTVANGQTTITSSSIAQAAGAPILTSSLLQAIQADTLNYGVDVGTVNVLQANYQLPITALTDNMNLWVKPKFTNTGACTFTPNPGVIPPAPVVGGNHTALQGNEFLATGRSNLVYRLDITSWVLVESTGGAIQAAPATASQQVPQLGQVQTGSTVKGLIATNDPSNLNALMDITCLSVTYRDPIAGAHYVGLNVSVQNSIITAGPVANGRDQAAAFAASQWIRYYMIYNPTTGTSASICSLALPSVGPTLPAGYTAWTYLFALYYNSTPALPVVDAHGSRVTYRAPIVAVSAGAATTNAPVSITTMVPPEALMMNLSIPNLGITGNSSGLYADTLVLGVITGYDAYQCGLQGSANASAAQFTSGANVDLPNLSQGFNYRHTIGTGTSPTCIITLRGYSVPNGGEA